MPTRIQGLGSLVHFATVGVVFCLVVSTACAPPASPPPTPTPTPGPTATPTPIPGPLGAEVSMQGVTYSPSTVTIKQGESVRWTNIETQPVVHTVTSGRPEDANAGSVFDSGLISQGQSFTFTFNTPGDYIYFCRPHFTMGMRDAHVIVTAGP